MLDHLNREQIAALLDEPDGAASERAHLNGCEECSREYEQMVRMRMALSALPDLAPPSGEWDRVLARIDTGLSWLDRSTEGRPGIRFRPLWAAAVVALFAAGVGIGRQMASDGAGMTDLSASRDAPATTAELADGSMRIDEGATEDDMTEAYLRSVAEMQELRREGPSEDELWEDPSLAAERLMKLDALIEASREALRTAPSDPVLNDFLFDVVDERSRLSGRLNQSLRYTSVEY